MTEPVSEAGTAAPTAPGAVTEHVRRVGVATAVAPPMRTLGLHRRDGVIGWLFAAPAIIGLVIFLVIPIVLTVWVSFRDWSGLGSPFESKFNGLANYRELLTEPGIRRKDFAISLRNTFYYVLIVVPVQTLLAMFLAFLVNQKFLKGRGAFRTLLYFPSVTSSIAITLIWLVLFFPSGIVNRLLPGKEVKWFDEPNGVIHNIFGVFGVDRAPSWAKGEIFELSIWEWISGPSVAMVAIMLLAIWTTSGTMMLIFLGGLQNISTEVEEAASIDGAGWWQRFRLVIIPMLRPQIYLAVTLGVIGTWQVFDQVYAANAGGPQKTTLTPAYLVFQQAFDNSKAGLAAATAVILFFIIMIFTWIQRRVTGSSERVV
jgi:multiple sugar transport system permease protein